MSAILEDLKARALQLSPPDRDELVRALIASIDGEPEGTPEEIARAWDEEIERRVADLEAGRTVGIPADQVLAEIRAMIADHAKR
ncbi:MAG TPA: addiction module protein [Burkholderiales bacterium]|nr:addiction module protein [Burkholderiales bacterium]